MLAEEEGRDPAQAMANANSMDVQQDAQQAQQDTQSTQQDEMVSLVAEIRKIMGRLTFANQSDVAHDPNLMSFIDIIEALNTTEEVIRDRLSTEGADVDDPRGGTQHIAAMGAEHQGDAEKNYEILFNSIEDQIKDTIRSVFTVSSGAGETGNLPLFVQAYNALIVDRLIDALRTMGPAQAKNAIGGIIEAAKNAVYAVESGQGEETTASIKMLVQKYRRARNRTIGKKHATARNKRDRMNLNTAMASSTAGAE